MNHYKNFESMARAVADSVEGLAKSLVEIEQATREGRIELEKYAGLGLMPAAVERAALSRLEAFSYTCKPTAVALTRFAAQLAAAKPAMETQVILRERLDPTLGGVQ